MLSTEPVEVESVISGVIKKRSNLVTSVRDLLEHSLESGSTDLRTLLVNLRLELSRKSLVSMVSVKEAFLNRVKLKSSLSFTNSKVGFSGEILGVSDDVKDGIKS